MNVLALSERKRIFLRTKKADQKHCESGSECHKHPRMCERGEWRKQLRDFITQSLKQTHLGSGTFSMLFWSNGSLSNWRKTITFPQPCVFLCFIKPILGNRYVRSRKLHRERAKGDCVCNVSSWVGFFK